MLDLSIDFYLENNFSTYIMISLFRKSLNSYPRLFVLRR